MSECKNEDIKFECACVCICACKFAQAAIFAAANDCMYVCITYMYVCIFVCVYLCMYVVCTYVCICVYICLCIFNVRNIYISMRVFVCVCIHVCGVVLAKILLLPTPVYINVKHYKCNTYIYVPGWVCARVWVCVCVCVCVECLYMRLYLTIQSHKNTYSRHRTLKMHRVPYLHGPFSTTEPYNQWLFCGKRPATQGNLCIFDPVQAVDAV